MAGGGSFRGDGTLQVHHTPTTAFFLILDLENLGICEIWSVGRQNRPREGCCNYTLNSSYQNNSVRTRFSRVCSVGRASLARGPRFPWERPESGVTRSPPTMSIISPMSSAVFSSKTLVVLLCMHRSGSSLTAHLLQRLGISLGPFPLLVPDEHNKYGYFEPWPFYHLNQELLGQVFGFSEDVPTSAEILQRLCACEGRWKLQSLRGLPKLLERAREIVRALLDSGPISAFKDPRVALLWPFWRQVFSEFAGLRVMPLVLIRSPHEIAMSLFARSNGTIAYANALDVTTVHLKRLGEIRDSWTGQQAVVRFDVRTFREDLRCAVAMCGLRWNDAVFDELTMRPASTTNPPLLPTSRNRCLHA